MRYLKLKLNMNVVHKIATKKPKKKIQLFFFLLTVNVIPIKKK